MSFFIFFRYDGLDDNNLYIINQEGVDFSLLLSLGMKGGFLFGFLYVVLDIILKRSGRKNRSSGSIIFINAVCHVILVLIVNIAIRNVGQRLLG